MENSPNIQALCQKRDVSALKKKRRLTDSLFPRDYFRRHVKGLPPIPAYLYHQVDAIEFEFLCNEINHCGFQTLTFSELLQLKDFDKRTLLLTFDDGWSSVWSIAFPLALRYGIRFTLFIAPQAIEDSNECRSTLDDGVEPSLLVARDRGLRCMLTWGEVTAMHESGLVDVQSHTLNHGVVFNSDKICGLSLPENPFPLHGFVPLLQRERDRDQAKLYLPTGTPLFSLGPALATSKRFIEDSNFRDQTINILPKNRDHTRFIEGNWDSLLKQLEKQANKGRWETEDERRQRYQRDLAQAKRTIENQLPGSNVIAVAPPWAVMHHTLPDIAKETDHKICVLGYPFSQVTGTNDLPLYPRLKGDMIWTLLHGAVRGGIRWLKERNHNILLQKSGAIP